MKVKEIHDDNTLIETYLHYLIEHHRVEVDLIGYMKGDMSFGIYYIWDTTTNRYLLCITDLDKYTDKRTKKKSSKEKRATTFLCPSEDKYRKVTDKNFEAVLAFFGGGETDLIMDRIMEFSDVQDYLKKS